MRKSPSWGHHGRREGSLQNFECRPQRHLEGDQERVQSTRSQGYSSSFILLFTLFFGFESCDLGVKQYHPDMNKNPGAEDKFKQISAAYEVTTKSSPFSLFWLTLLHCFALLFVAYITKWKWSILCRCYLMWRRDPRMIVLARRV